MPGNVLSLLRALTARQFANLAPNLTQINLYASMHTQIELPEHTFALKITKDPLIWRNRMEVIPSPQQPPPTHNRKVLNLAMVEPENGSIGHW